MPQPLPATISGAGRKERGGRKKGLVTLQDAVAKWNVIIFRKCTIARDLLTEYTILVIDRAQS